MLVRGSQDKSFRILLHLLHFSFTQTIISLNTPWWFRFPHLTGHFWSLASPMCLIGSSGGQEELEGGKSLALRTERSDPGPHTTHAENTSPFTSHLTA